MSWDWRRQPRSVPGSCSSCKRQSRHGRRNFRRADPRHALSGGQKNTSGADIASVPLHGAAGTGGRHCSRGGTGAWRCGRRQSTQAGPRARE